ncbi:hypothetical protein PVAP13_5NG498600 [Panicum virgatum]|uniref:Uncharacterized protein n=1 Tax=Panicum virgatum TaxID=38727 RepID=A0A8T0S135_PANVG|nr:hypothetical protein PVAP13_5NG498600 [Panicum virgatum]
MHRHLPHLRSPVRHRHHRISPDPPPSRQETPSLGSAARDIAQNSAKRIKSNERVSAVTLTERGRKKKSAVASQRTGDRKKSPPPPRNPATGTSCTPRGVTGAPTLSQKTRRYKLTLSSPEPEKKQRRHQKLHGPLAKRKKQVSPTHLPAPPWPSTPPVLQSSKRSSAQRRGATPP